MSTPEIKAPDSREREQELPVHTPALSVAPRPRLRGRVLTILAVSIFVAVSAAMIAANGLFLSRDWLLLWVLVGLLVLTLTDVKRWVRGLVFDWLPFAAFLVFYDLSRFFSEQLRMTPHVAPQIQADRILFGDPIPTVRLQHALYHWPRFEWFDYGLWGVYMTHFFTTLLTAALLWRFAYPLFRRFRTMVLTLAGFGFATYVLFPAVPPWMASNMHQLEHTRRVMADTWEHLGVGTANAFLENHSAFFNQVAAVPSMHAAYPLMFVLFFWSTGRWWVRAGTIAYALLMAFTLVYSAEHYVADILLGWVYAVAAFTLVTAAGRWRAARRGERAVAANGAGTLDPASLRPALETAAERASRE